MPAFSLKIKWADMMRCRRYILFGLMRLTFYSFSVLLTGSCSEDYEKNAVRPEYDIVNWEIPNSYKLMRSYPVGVQVAPDGKYLLCGYWIELERADASAICIVNLTSQDSRWLTIPCRAGYRPLSAKILGVFVSNPSFADHYSGHFLDIDSLTRIGPAIPIGTPYSSDESQFVAVVNWNEQGEDIWLYNFASGMEIVMPTDQHGLNHVILAISTNFLVINGRTAGYRGPPDRIKTQIWKLPDLEKIWEHETKDTFPWRSTLSPFAFNPLILGKDTVCFSQAVGLRKVASLSTGELRFSIRSEAPYQFCWVMVDTGYVEDTNRIVCLKTSTRGKKADIITYDIKTGRELHAVTIPYENFEFIKIVEVAGEWIILCGWSEPKEEPASYESSIEPRKMWIVPYRLNDLKKAKHSMEITWGGFPKPEVFDGKMVSVFTDHALIYDLSDVMAFDKK